MAETYTPTPVRNTAYSAVEDGDQVDAASVRPMFEGLADHGEFLAQERDGHETRLDAHDTAIASKGGLADTNTWTGINQFQHRVVFTGDYVWFGAGTMLRTPQVVDLADVPSQLIGPEDGWYFRIDSTFSGGHIVRLRDTGTPTLVGGETIEIFFDAVGAEGVDAWEVRRETNGGGSDNILTFNNSPYTPDVGMTSARFQFKSGVGWICAGGSGAIAPGAHFRS